MSNNNLTVKSLVNTIQKKYTVTTPTPSPTDTKNGIVDNILTKIKTNTNLNLKYWFMFILPIIALLCYLLYSYNVTARTNYVISTMNYKKHLKNTPLLQCFQQDSKYQFRLCDYYISSSYMTPCIGNQHYDYVSNDMISEVIQSGARYIQIPICEADVGLEALPVIGTAFYGAPLITSLNTLEITTTFKTIASHAFILNNKKINYPLIIHLILNTSKKFTLNVVADAIKEVFDKDVLLDVSKYNTFPICLEKLCNLLGKIIIISTPEYIGSKLESYVVPDNNMFHSYLHNELAEINLPNTTLHKTSYNNKLSSTIQKNSASTFQLKYPTVKYIVQNAKTIGKTILNDKQILNNLISFNKVCMSIITPNSNVDIVSTNYKQNEAVFLGCQLITMNFQVNDINMKHYLEIFKESSFRLKPSDMRFIEQVVPEPDLLSIYEKFIRKNDNILNDFYYKYNNTLISIESYALLNTFITQIENNLHFKVSLNQKTNPDGSILTYKLDISQCFIPRKSTIGATTNISMYLESAALPGMYITLSGDIFIIKPLEINKKGLVNQAFYIEKSKTTDIEHSENKGQMISIRTFNDDEPLYLSFDNKMLKAYGDLPQIQAQNNMSFFTKIVKYQMIINIITLYDGSLKAMSGNIIGVLETNTTDGTPFIVIPTNQTGGNFDIFKNQFMLQNKATKNYISFDNATGFIYDRDLMPSSNGIFNLEPTHGYYAILNVNNHNLILYDRNLVKFVDNKIVKSNEHLFKLSISYDLLE